MPPLHPYLAKPHTGKINGNNVLLIWAQNAQDAVAKAQQQSANTGLYEIIEISPAQVILPAEMFCLRKPEEFCGEHKTVQSVWGESETYIVPDLLQGHDKAIVYTRVSTPAQAHNSSFARQRASCEEFARCAGLEIVHYYEEVESGAFYQARPHLQNALSAIEARQATILLVESLDRLHRDQSVGERIWERLIQADARLVCCETQRIGSAEFNFAAATANSAHSYRIDLLRELGCIF